MHRHRGRGSPAGGGRRRDQAQVAKAHVLERARGRADVAGLMRLNQHEGEIPEHVDRESILQSNLSCMRLDSLYAARA